MLTELNEAKVWDKEPFESYDTKMPYYQNDKRHYLISFVGN